MTTPRTRLRSYLPQVLDMHESAVRPETDLQALMEAAPNHEPVESTESIHRRSDENTEFMAVEAVLKTFGWRERDVIEQVVMQNRSVRDVADDLGMSKSTVHRLKEEALAKLRAQMTGGE